MNIAFVYAGQGSQVEKMGLDLYQNNSIFKNVLDTADVDGTYKEIMFNGTLEKLSDTQYTQPCMVLFTSGITQVLKQNGVTPKMVAGLSLGEYSALNAAQVLDAKTAVELVAFRGKAMKNAVTGIECGMQAVLGLEKEKLQNACDKASGLGVVEIANYNCPGQLVIAGEKNAVEKAAEYAKENGAKRCVPLNVSGPFHTSLMKKAGDELCEKFKTINFENMQIPVVFNCTASEIKQDETVPMLLEKQVQSSVYFEDTITYMQQNGIDTIIEIGPGKVLTGFIKKTAKQIQCYQVQDVESLEKTLQAIKEG